MITDAEMVEAIAALSPPERAAAHEYASTVSDDLEAAGRTAAAWIEVASFLLATTMLRCHVNGQSKGLVEQLREFALRRADAIASDLSKKVEQ